jgi:uncharacterized protein
MDTIVKASEPSVEAVISEKPFPALIPSALWIVLYFALQLVVTVVVISVALIAQKMADPATALDPLTAAENPMMIIWGLVASAVLQLILMWLYLRKGDRAEIIGLSHFGRISIGRTILVAITAIAVATAFNHVYATYIISGIPMQDDMAKLLATIPRTPINITVGVFAIAVIAPLIEELLFRGLLQKSLMNHVPAWGAIVLSAFIFAAVHMQLYAMPALMALGAAFGYIYYKTGSLRMTIVLHMVNNALALALTQAT